ncbi:MAG TPA: FtsW/RodA/SpoVE family cell cycle protein [Thermomicrobiales bacterium]|nr:FtsW/RodA/SpoVE family cell cycle protein [Thermomicrobiales bacterium]
MVSIAGARRGRVGSSISQPTEYDPFIVVLVIVLGLFGLVTIWSASGGGPITAGSQVVRQGFYLFTGLIAMFALSTVHYRFLKSFAAVFYLGSVALLVSLLVIGSTEGGSTRWIMIGPLSLQPSEVAKIAVIIALAAFISERHDEMDRFSNFLISIAIVGLPMGLVFIQPDLGTTGVFAAIWLGMILMSSTRMLYVAGLCLLSLPGAYVAWNFLMHDYQKDRLLIAFDPYKDYLGEGFNIIQAQVTIGSAGWFGHGLTGGSQSEFQLLKVRETDFIFAHAMSMFGFVGGLALFFTFMLLLWRMLRVVNISPDTFGQQIAAGMTTMIFFQTFVNIGMNLGLLPVTGITLPFISLGGTSLFVTLASFGIIQSIVVNHRRLGFQAG